MTALLLALALSAADAGTEALRLVASGGEVAFRHPSVDDLDPGGRDGWAQFSPDGRSLASWRRGSTVVWDSATGARQLELPIQAQALAFSPDGSLVVVGDKGQVGAYELASRRRRWLLDRGTNSVAISPDGRRVVMLELSGLSAVDATTGATQWTVRFPGPARNSFSTGSLRFSSDGKRLLLGGAVYDAASGAELQPKSLARLMRPRVAVRDEAGSRELHLVVAERGRAIEASSGERKPTHLALEVWNLARYEKSASIPATDADPLPTAIALSATGAYALVAGTQLAVLDLDRGVELARIPGAGSPREALLAPDAATALTWTHDELSAWDVRGKRRLWKKSLQVFSVALLAGHVLVRVLGDEFAVLALEDGRAVLAAKGLPFADPAGQRLAIFTSGRFDLRRFPGGQPVVAEDGPTASLRALVVSSDGTQALSGGQDGQIWLWDAAGMGAALPGTAGFARAGGVAFWRGRARALLWRARPVPRWEVLEWSLASRARLSTTPLPGSAHAALMPDGRVVFDRADCEPNGAECRRAYSVVELATGATRGRGLVPHSAFSCGSREPDPGVEGAAFSEDGRWAYTIGSCWQSVTKWAVAGGKEAAVQVAGGGGFGKLSARSDGAGRVLVRGDGLALWDLSTRQPARTFELPHPWVVALALSGDGSWAAASSPEGAVFVWRTSEGGAPAQTLTLPTKFDCAASLAFGPSGDLWVGTGSGQVLRYSRR